jgi:hypothetical protein
MTSFRPLLGIATAALLAGFGLFGCASVSDSALMFKETQRRYTNLMRFTEFAKAGRFVAPDERAAFRDRTAALGNLRFTDYEVREIENLGETATAEVAYIGYRASDPIVVTYIEKQQWERNGGVWLVRPHIAERTP